MTGLIHGITLHCFVQSGEAFMVKGNKHTHIHTQILT